MIKIKVTITKETAINAGRANAGDFYVEIDDAFVSALSSDERKSLLIASNYGIPNGSLATGSRRPSEPTEATLEAVCSYIKEQTRLNLEFKAKEAQEKADKYRKLSEEVIAWSRLPIEERIQATGYGWTKKSRPYVESFSSLTEEAQEALNLADREAEAEAKRLVAEKEEKELERKKEAAALIAENQRKVREWVELHGTPSQVQRMRENLLPEKELLDTVRDRLLPDADRYVRIHKRDIEHGPECEHSTPVFKTYPATGGLTEEEYQKLTHIKQLMEGQPATFEVKEHKAWCETEDCTGGTLIRSSVSVTIEWNGYELSREYALT